MAIALLQPDDLELAATFDTQAQIVDDEAPTQIFVAGQPISKVMSALSLSCKKQSLVNSAVAKETFSTLDKLLLMFESSLLRTVKENAK
ncbi:hypothetical protein A6770_06235 [Nostoc minutum NIES-26]|uniref:Uncharacterized protein n=1 Tax=Nostoc minutum NIES-26 TaxID=1844469 RepID=A0A367Q4X2_9NOSO|nr:hypothetical protein A6770_06235 [Nostoc minutum NIES-26]